MLECLYISEQYTQRAACAVMQGRLTVVRTLPDGRNFAMGVRFTSTCVRTSEGFKVAFIHASAAADFHEEG